MTMPKFLVDADTHFMEVITRDIRPYMTTKEVSDALQIPPRRVQEMARQNKLPFGFVTESGTGRRDGCFLKAPLYRWYFASGMAGKTMPDDV